MQAQVASAADVRATPGSRNVASTGRSQIEELSPSTSISFDQNAQLLPNDLGNGSAGRRRQLVSVPDQRGNGPVPSTTTNETYSAMFRLADFPGVEVQPKPFVRGPRGFGGLLPKAVGTYETNAKVIHGQLARRGQTVRLAV